MSNNRFEIPYTDWEVRPTRVVDYNDYYKKSGSTSAFNHQESGTHYKDMGIQPVEYIMANGLGFCEGNCVKYVTRYKSKGGIADLKKARHYLDMLIETLEKQ